MSDTPIAAPASNADNAAPQPVATAQTTAPADWRSTLPDDIKQAPTLSKFSSVESLAKSYVNIERMLGAEKVVRPPKDNFDPSLPEWQAFLDAGGRPASPDEYKFEKAQLPEGLPYDEALEGKFKQVAHMAGLNNKQAHMLRDMFAAYQAEAHQSAMTEFKQTREQAEASLQAELGSAYEPYVNAAKAALKEYADERFVQWLEQSGNGNNPEIIRVFGKIGKEMLGETKLQTPNNGSMDTPADWKRKADEYRSQYANALFDNTHPDHKRRTDEYTAMFQKAFPS